MSCVDLKINLHPHQNQRLATYNDIAKSHSSPAEKAKKIKVPGPATDKAGTLDGESEEN